MIESSLQNAVDQMSAKMTLMEGKMKFLEEQLHSCPPSLQPSPQLSPHSAPQSQLRTPSSTTSNYHAAIAKQRQTVTPLTSKTSILVQPSPVVFSPPTPPAQKFAHEFPIGTSTTPLQPQKTIVSVSRTSDASDGLSGACTFLTAIPEAMLENKPMMSTSLQNPKLSFISSLGQRLKETQEFLQQSLHRSNTQTINPVVNI